MPGAIWKRWSWVEAGLIPLISAVMRAAWLAPLTRLLLDNPFVAPRGTLYPAWLILGLLLAASALEALVRDHPQGRLILVVGGLLAVVGSPFYLFPLPRNLAALGRLGFQLADFRLGFPAPLIVIVITALLWRRGLTILWHSYDELWRGFVTGMLLLGLMMLLGSRIMGQPLALWGAMTVFLLSGLLALAILSVTGALALERAAGSRPPPLSRYWLVAVGTVVLLTLLAGWLLGQALSPETVGRLLGWLRPLRELLGLVVQYILMAIAYVTIWLLMPLINWLRRGAPPEELPQEEARRGLADMWKDIEVAQSGLPPTLAAALRIAFVVGLVAGIAFAFWLAWRLRDRRRNGDVEEQREYIWSKELLLSQLRGLLRRGPRGSRSPYLLLDDPADPRQAVRLLYQNLLALARRLGQPRTPHVTPSAYEETLDPLFPGESEALDTLTQTYLVARYAADPPTPEQVSAARRALERLRAAIRR